MNDSDQLLFEAAFHSASIGIALVGLDGTWQRVNRAICEIVGYTEAELMALTFQDITHPEDLEADLALVQRLAAGEIASYGLEKRYFHKTGRIVWIQLNAALARDAAGPPLVFVSQIQDITRRKDAEAHLQETLATKESLLSELTTAYEETKRLRDGLLTVCAWTKRIRYEGEWITTDQFLQKHLHLRLTHGISDEAKAAVLAELQTGFTGQRRAPAPTLSPAVELLAATPPDAVFDRFTGLATDLFHVPAALISVIDESRQFFQSMSGVPEPLASLRETPLSHSFCQHVVRTGQPFIVSDARENELVRDNPAIQESSVIAYAGAPIFDEDGQAFAALCVIDSKPRTWSEEEVSLLQTLARQVTSEVHFRQKVSRLQMDARGKDGHRPPEHM